MKKNVLIFGVGGFVGAYLAKEFHDNAYEVFGSDITKANSIPDFVDFSENNILNSNSIKELIKKIQPTHIVNLAAISSVELSWKIPQKTIAVNVEGALNILEAAKECIVLPRILLIGSSEEYTISKDPIDEQYEINANNPYGISKVVQEQFSGLYRKRYDMKIYYVRAFNHTGIGQADTFVIPSWCKQVAEISKSGKPGTIFVGNLAAKRDFSNVKDIVRAYRTVIESNDCTRIYNVGSGFAVALQDILAYIVSLSEQPITVVTDPERFRPVDNLVICCNKSYIEKELGWKPNYNIFDTVKEMFEFYLNQTGG